MGRKTLIRSTEFPYHVTARANNREIFPCGLNELWNIHLYQLREIEDRYSVRVHAFVLMNNHFHLIISTPKEDLGKAMQFFMRSVTQITNSRTGRSGRIFGGKYHWSLIDSTNYYDTALKYVYRNPVKADVVSKVTDYQFSTLNAALGKHRLGFDLHPPAGETLLVPHGEEHEFVDWLNEPFKAEEYEAIRNALKKEKFKPWVLN